MVRDPWLPLGLKLPDGVPVRGALFEGEQWQLYDAAGKGRALVVEEELAQRWLDAGILAERAFTSVVFGGHRLTVLQSAARHELVPLVEATSPSSLAESMAFAAALRETRKLVRDVPLHDAIYVERYSRLLPTWSSSEPGDDALVLGRYLTGGANVSARSFERLAKILSWLSREQVQSVIEAAGLAVGDIAGATRVRVGGEQHEAAEMGSGAAQHDARAAGGGPFRLPGRPELERFFREHVIDIVQNADTYRALGIEFPSPIVLHGPPGCGKTFAVEALAEYLGWPTFSLDSSTIGSPYIHETGKKIAKAFEDATKASPALVIVDEMDAFLSDRQLGGGQGLHHVEEVAEFLRRIPEAIKNHVLLIGMTNRIDVIDPAILRRGRFDHVIHVGMPSAEEVRSLVDNLLAGKPCEDVDREALVTALEHRPLSDVSFVIREAARLAAKAGRKLITQGSVVDALRLLPQEPTKAPSPKPIGFRQP